MQRTYKWEEMLPDEFIKAVEQMPVFIIPTGLLEWHGNHLPLGQDTLKVYGICTRIAEKLGGGIVLPPNYYGRPGFSRYVGTLTYSEGLMNLLFTELFYQLKKVGAKVIVLITGHYGSWQVNFVKRVAEFFTADNPDIKIIAQPEYENVTLDGEVPADHAGKWETSMFWYMYPELTYMENYKNETIKIPIYKNPPNDIVKEKEIWNWKDNLGEVSSRELGEKAVNAIIDYFVIKIKQELENI